jgi:ribosomal protein S18 acetylase RimI-like enzyme
VPNLDATLTTGGRDPELSSQLSDGLDEHNKAATGHSEQLGLSVKVTAADGSLIAGLAGWTWAECAGIEMVWVHPDHRKDGWGAKLIEAAEAEARRRGCTDISVSSFTFQAPRFYQRLGYKVTGERLGFPGGARDVIMWKSLVGRLPVELAVVVDYDDGSGRAVQEREMAAVLEHGGRVERRLLAADGRSEVQVIWFPDRAAYDGFRADSARSAGPSTARFIEV